MRIKILRGVNVQTANGVSPASAGAVVEVTEKCGRELIADGRAVIAPEESTQAIQQEVREEPIKKKMMKR